MWGTWKGAERPTNTVKGAELCCKIRSAAGLQCAPPCLDAHRMPTNSVKPSAFHARGVLQVPVRNQAVGGASKIHSTAHGKLPHVPIVEHGFARHCSLCSITA